MGLSSSSSRHVYPLTIVNHVYMDEVEEMTVRIEKAIDQCTKERELIRENYNSNPASIPLSSCTCTCVFRGNADKTFQLINNRFGKRVASIKLGMDIIPDRDNYSDYTATVYFSETNTINIIV